MRTSSSEIRSVDASRREADTSRSSADSSPLSLLVFALDAHRFALWADVVDEIVRAVAISPLPRGPAIVEGLINLRGSIVPVLDVRGRFSLPARRLAPEQHFIVARAGRRRVALRVDRALDVLALPADARTPDDLLPKGIEQVGAVVRLADGLVLVHDLERFLALDEEVALDRALAELEGPP